MTIGVENHNISMDNKKNKSVSLNWDEFRALGNPDNVPDIEEEEINVDPMYDKQIVRVAIEKKGRGGKCVSIVKGIRLQTMKHLENLSKDLKKICGVGGSIKNGEIIIQGDNRDKIIAHLKSLGVKDIKKTGG